MRLNFSRLGLTVGLVLALGSMLAGQNDKLIVINEDLQLLPLSEELFVHISWTESETYGRFSSNGLLFIRNGQALMVDTPMEEEKTVTLVDYIRENLGARVRLAVPGHFHDDCVAGLPYLHRTGAKSLSGKKTQSICRAQGKIVPKRSFAKKKNIRFRGKRVQLRYFGAGHAPDNIVVYFPDEKVLFGGCMIRSLPAKDLGNTGDAVIEEWGHTVGKILQAFPGVKTVIPGHGPVGDAALLHHTIELVNAFR